MSIAKEVIKFTVLGEPASKANSRQIVTIRGKPAIIKSAKARAYETTFWQQCPNLDPLMKGDLKVTIKIHYATRRPDLDESVILDCMQAQRQKLPNGKIEHWGRIYKNDRQVKIKYIYWALDRDNPRAEITVEQIEPTGWVLLITS